MRSACVIDLCLNDAQDQRLAQGSAKVRAARGPGWPGIPGSGPVPGLIFENSGLRAGPWMISRDPGNPGIFFKYGQFMALS